MASPKLKELQEKLDAKRKALTQVFDEAGPDLDMDQVKSLDGDSHAKVEAIRQMNAELDDLAKQVEELWEIEKAASDVEKVGRLLDDPAGRLPTATAGAEQKSFGDLFIESGAHKAKGKTFEVDIDVKTLMTTTAGWAPEVIRTDRVVEYATRPIQVIDLIPSVPTGQSAVAYMEETTFTNAAAETAEAAAYPEAALALTERSSPVRKISVFLPVTDEQLEDEPRVRAYINNRLPFMLRQRLDSQILNGDGVAPNLTGILNTSGIQTQAKGADPTPDAVHKAMTLVRTTGWAQVTAALFNSADWEEIRLLRTADGIYIWGAPSESGPMRIWGVPVILADALPAGTGLVGDFANFTELAIRRGVEVKVSDSHGTYFVEGKQAVRADIRVAFTVYRPAAFATVTGI